MARGQMKAVLAKHVGQQALLAGFVHDVGWNVAVVKVPKLSILVRVLVIHAVRKIYFQRLNVVAQAEPKVLHAHLTGEAHISTTAVKEDVLVELAYGFARFHFERVAVVLIHSGTEVVQRRVVRYDQHRALVARTAAEASVLTSSRLRGDNGPHRLLRDPRKRLPCGRC